MRAIWITKAGGTAGPGPHRDDEPQPRRRDLLRKEPAALLDLPGHHARFSARSRSRSRRTARPRAWSGYGSDRSPRSRPNVLLGRRDLGAAEALGSQNGRALVRTEAQGHS